LKQVQETFESHQKQNKNKMGESKGEWSVTELSDLAKAVMKFPGGARNRWKSIQTLLPHRSIKEIITKVKLIDAESDARALADRGLIALKEDAFASSQAKAMNKNKNKEVNSVEISTGSIYVDAAATNSTTKDNTDDKNKVKSNTNDENKVKSNGDARKDVESVQNEAKSNGDAKSASETTQSNGTAVVNEEKKETTTDNGSTTAEDKSDTVQAKLPEDWSADEQKLLEEALAKYPGPGKERWTDIAKHVGKTRKECVQRYKYCVSLVKNK